MARILVIDDEPDLRAMLRELLEEEHHEVFEAENGRSGLSAARSEWPDLILCDVNMPEFNGFDVVQSLQEESRTSAIPLVMMTGLASLPNMRRGMTLGAADFLPKPFTPDELLMAVETQLNKSRVLHENAGQSLTELRSHLSLVLPHELIAPLNGVLGASEILMRDAPGLDHNQIAAFSKAIHDSASRLHQTIKRVLLYSQIQLLTSDTARREALCKDGHSRPTVLNARLSVEQCEAAGRGGEIRWDVPNAAVAIPEEHLDRILEELVSNAVKFSDAGSRISISGECSEPWLRLSIRDEGRGLSSEEQSKIGAFVQFQRSVYEQQGVGLGLVIARSLVEIYGGRISIRPNSDRGTTIELCLPLCSDSNGAAATNLTAESAEPLLPDLKSRDAAPMRRPDHAVERSDGRIHAIEGIVWELNRRTGRFEFVSRHAERLLGYPAAEWINDPEFLSKHLHPADRSWVPELLRQPATASQQKNGVDFRMIAADGGEVWLRNFVSQHPGNEGTNLGLGVDITRARVTADEFSATCNEALNSARLKSEFLANMSHELRTPMNGVMGMTELLQETELSSQQRGYVDAIGSSSDSLLRLLNDILDLSKIEAGKLQFEAVEFDLAKLVEQTVEIQALAARKKDLDFGLLLPPECFVQVTGDPGRLRQVLNNLISNATKFTDHGSVLIRGTTVETDPDGTLFRFEVEDSGIGITDEVQSRLFQSFSQANESTTRQYGGTGLGLAISKQLTKGMGGDIGVSSESGAGSTFWFTVRLQVSVCEGTDGAPLRFPEKPPGVVLLPRDGKVGRLLQAQLHAWRIDCELAEDETSVIKALRLPGGDGSRPGVVMIDSGAADLDTVALVRRIQEDPLLANPKVILLSSPARSGNPEETFGREHGRLVKPVIPSRLADCVDRIIRNKPLVDPAAESSVPAKSRPSANANTPPRECRILVVDDNAVNLEVVIEALRRFGWTGDSAMNGAQALEAVSKQQYDVILMDCQMPVMDGYQAARQIRLMERKRADAGEPVQPVHIIALTAYTAESDRQRALKEGMNDHLAKPIRMGTLRAALDRWPGAAQEGAQDKAARSAETRKTIGKRNLREMDAGLDPAAVAMFKNIAVTSGPQFLYRLKDTFLNDASGLLTRIKDSVGKEDWESVRSAAHTLHGTSINIGAVRMGNLARKLEKMAGAGPVPQASGRLNEMELELVRVRSHLEEHFCTTRS
ncbi:MAG: response regulator [Verrucomicrobia bacterium]|nr:response regulator [Verrucomicrobiota bacterium]